MYFQYAWTYFGCEKTADNSNHVLITNQILHCVHISTCLASCHVGTMPPLPIPTLVRTVVKWGHTEGKNFVWKIYCFFPLNLRVLPADSDGSICKKWMQNALRFVMKNRSFSSLKNNFKIRIKSYSEGNTLRFRGKKQYIFQTKFFPSVCPWYALGMPSVCPHLTTVCSFPTVFCENIFSVLLLIWLQHYHFVWPLRRSIRHGAS